MSNKKENKFNQLLNIKSVSINPKDILSKTDWDALDVKCNPNEKSILEQQSEKQNGGYFDNYHEHGGIVGHAHRVLFKELTEASSNKKHPLYTTAQAVQKGDNQTATQTLILALQKAYDDDSSPLKIPALIFYQIPLVKAAHDQTVSDLNSNKLPTDYFITKEANQTILIWASISMGIKGEKSKAGSQKGKANKEQVLTAWGKYNHKERGASAFANWYFKKLGGAYDKNGKKITRHIPSERTIAEWVRQYEKSK